MLCIIIGDTHQFIDHSFIHLDPFKNHITFRKKFQNSILFHIAESDSTLLNFSHKLRVYIIITSQHKEQKIYNEKNQD